MWLSSNHSKHVQESKNLGQLSKKHENRCNTEDGISYPRILLNRHGSRFKITTNSAFAQRRRVFFARRKKRGRWAKVPERAIETAPESACTSTQLQKQCYGTKARKEANPSVLFDISDDRRWRILWWVQWVPLSRWDPLHRMSSMVRGIVASAMTAVVTHSKLERTFSLYISLVFDVSSCYTPVLIKITKAFRITPLFLKMLRVWSNLPLHHWISVYENLSGMIFCRWCESRKKVKASRNGMNYLKTRFEWLHITVNLLSTHKSPNGNSPLTASNLKVLETRQQMRSLRPLPSHEAIFYCPTGRELEVKGFGPYCSTISRALWSPISIWPHSSSIKNSGREHLFWSLRTLGSGVALAPSPLQLAHRFGRQTWWDN